MIVQSKKMTQFKSENDLTYNRFQEYLEYLDYHHPIFWELKMKEVEEVEEDDCTAIKECTTCEEFDGILTYWINQYPNNPEEWFM